MTNSDASGGSAGASEPVPAAEWPLVWSDAKIMTPGYDPETDPRLAEMMMSVGQPLREASQERPVLSLQAVHEAIHLFHETRNVEREARRAGVDVQPHHKELPHRHSPAALTDHLSAHPARPILGAFVGVSMS